MPGKEEKQCKYVLATIIIIIIIIIIIPSGVHELDIM